MNKTIFLLLQLSVRYRTNAQNCRSEVQNRPVPRVAAARRPLDAGDRYFNELLIAVNLVSSLVPRPLTTAMMASAIPAAIKPYSIAVAPVWSAQNFRTNVIMGGSYVLEP
jgi:hypothetical protein